jgi:putative membrane protein
MMGGWTGFGWGPGSWIVMASLMVLFWGAAVTVVVLVLRARSGAPSVGVRSIAGAEGVLNERFARGEIDEAELSARRAALHRSP